MQAAGIREPATVTVGLTSEEVARRRAAGKGNPAPPASSRSYLQIFRENVFTFVNNVLFGLGIALVLVGRPLDALVSVGIVALNTLISVTQEIRAKRTLDRIALLTRPKATALRDGSPVEVAPQELVLGDVLQIGAGDQVVLDGRLLDGRVDMDVSVLTGESEPVPKKPGDDVYSGTFVVAGRALYEVTAIGEKSLANRITSEARTFRRVLTPLERQVRLVVRLLLAIMIALQLLLAFRALLLDVPAAQAVGNATVVAGLVPNGLFLSIAIAYALGSVRLINAGLLVQQSNAVESLSNVDTLCFDKTGTLTTNQLKVAAVEPAGGVPRADLEEALGILAASGTSANKTTRAIAEGYPHPPQPITAEVPFSSARRWSGIATSDEVLALGAPEVLRPQLGNPLGDALDAEADRWRNEGLRVLLLARHSDPASLDGGRLPAGMQALGIIAIRDELRLGVAETLAAFEAAGVSPKIISGDNPETVAALGRQAGLKADLGLADGSQIAALDDAALAELVDRTTVFGRTGPQDKARLVAALRSRHHYVAMLGDGVNDVLALKTADLAVAMNTGSQAARSVADIVLLKDNFASLVPAVGEGQRIRNGMQSILKLYLTRIGMVASVIVASLVIGVFPIDVRNGSAVTLFSVGLPTLALTLWARPGPVRGRAGLERDLAYFAVPAVFLGTTIGVFLFYGVLWIAAGFPDLDGAQPATQLARQIASAMPIAQTALTVFLVFCGLALFAFVVGWRDDRRPTLMAVALGGLFMVVILTPLRLLFALRPMNPVDVTVILAAWLVWLVLLTLTWRRRLVQRYLDLSDDSA